VGEDSLPVNTTAVAVSSNERYKGMGAVYVGTEPSAIYKSINGGEMWSKPGDILKLRSSGSWSFPPKPHTHHIRFIATDPAKPGLIYAAIEAGALIRSFDGGISWKDRIKGGPFDTHTLTTNPKAPGRVYSAAGDGYYESPDYGETWRSKERGLEHSYLYAVSAHPSDPSIVLVSASPGPWTAYSPDAAESYVYRKSHENGWKRVELVKNGESTVSVFAPNPSAEGEFYAVNSAGIFKSADSGSSWSKLAVPWPDSYRQNVWSVALIE
jgi:hypothetical protein